MTKEISLPRKNWERVWWCISKKLWPGSASPHFKGTGEPEPFFCSFFLCVKKAIKSTGCIHHAEKQYERTKASRNGKDIRECLWRSDLAPEWECGVNNLMSVIKVLCTGGWPCRALGTGTLQQVKGAVSVGFEGRQAEFSEPGCLCCWSPWSDCSPGKPSSFAIEYWLSRVTMCHEEI